MASSGKKKTTMAKLDRERRMRERRMDKAARKDARKQATAAGITTYDTDATEIQDGAESGAAELVRS